MHNNEQIASLLITMVDYDLAIREKLLQENRLGPGYSQEMEAVHRQNAEKLRAIIDRIGWPVISKVGPEASDAAWLIVQHSIGEPAFIKKCYALMKDSLSDINPQNLAYLFDRICYFEGKPQKYGTHYEGEDLYPVEDADQVNTLRQEIGMKPHPPELVARADISLHPGELHTDPEFTAWRVKTGWI